MFGMHQSHSDYRYFHARLSEARHHIFRGYTYDNEKPYDSVTATYRPAENSWPYSDDEVEAYRDLDVGPIVDRLGRFGGGGDLQRLFTLMDAFLLVQTEPDKAHLAGSRILDELMGVMRVHQTGAGPALFYYGCGRTELPVGRAFIAAATQLPRTRTEAADALLGALKS